MEVPGYGLGYRVIHVIRPFMSTFRYMARITADDERRTLAVESIDVLTAEEAQLYADIMLTRLYGSNDPPIAATLTTVLMKPDLKFEQWVRSCWRIDRRDWEYPES